jgi:hypothetical protein
MSNDRQTHDKNVMNTDATDSRQTEPSVRHVDNLKQVSDEIVKLLLVPRKYLSGLLQVAQDSVWGRVKVLRELTIV